MTKETKLLIFITVFAGGYVVYHAAVYFWRKYKANHLHDRIW